MEREWSEWRIVGKKLRKTRIVVSEKVESFAIQGGPRLEDG